MKNSFLILCLFCSLIGITQTDVFLDNGEYVWVETNNGSNTRAFGLNASDHLYIGSVEQAINNIFLFNQSYGIMGTFLPNGNFGLGTTNPLTKFVIQQPSHDAAGGLTIQDLHGRRIQLYGEGPSGRQVISTNTNNPLVFSLNGTERVRFSADGSVGIGTISPSEKLTVKGKILCSEVEVVDITTIPDYVFQKYYTGESSLKEDYVMPTLEEIEAFTKANHHLPEVPSAAEIKEEGLQLKEMTTILLQKVEELTLYTIEQEKRIKALEAELAKKQ